MLGQFSIGPSIKFGRSNLPNDIESIRESENYTEYGNNYAIGILNEYKLKNWFSVEIDLLFDHLSSQKFYFVDKNNSNLYKSNQLNKIGYLSIPLFLQFNYKKLNFNIGCQTSFRISEYTKLTITDQDNSQTIYEGNNYNMFLKKNIALTSAITYRLYENFELELRYIKGFVNIMNEKTGYVYNASTTQFLFGLNYKFDFKKKKSTEEIPEKNDE